MAVENRDGNDLLRRVSPRDLSVERSFLGLLMMNGTLLARVHDEFNANLALDDFSSEKNRLIYDAILKRATVSDDFNPRIIAADLENSGQLGRVGGTAYINTLVEDTGPDVSIVSYARILKDLGSRRRLIAVNEAISELAYNPEGKTIEEIYDAAQGLIFELAANKDEENEGPRSAVDLVVEAFKLLAEQKQAGMRGVATGFPELDDLTSGLGPGSLNIVAARPGVGKTSFAMNIVENIAMDPKVTKPALVFSLEMPSDQIITRMLCTFGRATRDALVQQTLTPGQLGNMYRKIQLLSCDDGEGHKIPKLFIDDYSGLSSLELRTRARKIAAEYGGLSVIMVDYIQLMRPSGHQENRALEVGEISRSLKMVAKDLKVPVIALSQLNREVEGRKDHRPMNSDLRESGSLEQDADLILFIDRKVTDKEGKTTTPDNGEATLIVGKNRHGGTGDIKLVFQGAYTAFYPKNAPEAGDDDDVPLPDTESY